MPKNWSLEEWDAFRRFADNVNPQSPHPLDEQKLLFQYDMIGGNK